MNCTTFLAYARKAPFGKRYENAGTDCWFDVAAWQGAQLTLSRL